MKKVFIGVIAALMLFAFTACEQSVPDLNGQVPTNAIITQTGVFVDGQAFDPTQFSVELTYKNGYTQTVSGSNMVTLDSGKAYVEPGDTVSVNVTTVGGQQNGQQVIGSATLVVKSIDSVTVTAPASLEEGADIESTAVKSLFTVTANYEGGTLTVKPSEFVLFNLDTTTADTDSTKPANNSVQVGIKLAKDATFKNSDKFSVVIADPDAEPVEEVNKWTGRIGYAITPASSSVSYIQRGEFDADSMVTLYKQIDVYGDSSEFKYEEIVPGANESLEITLAAPLAGTPKGDVRFAESATATVNFTYTYVKDEATGALETLTQASPSVLVGAISFEDEENGAIVGSSSTTAITISGIIADYATSLSAAWKGKGGVTGTAYDVNNNFAVGDFAVTVTWKSGCTLTKAAPTFTVEPATAPSLETANANYQVTLDFGNKTYVDQAVETTTYVSVNADPDFE